VAFASVTTIACAVGDGGDSGLGGNSVGEGAGTDAATTQGQSDAGPESDPSATGPGSTDPSSGVDTDDPGGEVCNGLDDDGDGVIDDGIPDLQCGVGACAATTAGCEGGVPSQCFPGTPTAEVCNGLDDDCNGMIDDALVEACDSTCGAGTRSCVAGAWGECDAPPASAEVCNVADDDCNGAVDDGLPGCRVGIHRWWHPVTGEHLYTTDVNEGLCCGFILEFADFFALYAAQQAQTVAFYRCNNPGGFHHYTTDPGCEGLPVNEGAMGYIGTAQLPGSTALYRSLSPANGDHFFTNSLDEHNYAVGTLGFIDEGVVGWVW